MSPTLPPPNTTSPPSFPNSSFFFLKPQSNSTTYYSDEELQDPGLSEMETVALACFLTLLPLIFGLISYFGLRHCWSRWRRTVGRRTVEPSELNKTLEKEVTERSKSSHALLNDQISQMKTSESEFSVMVAEEVEEALNQTSKLAANGSVITMTMKNNHLIVETEERLDEQEEVLVENAVEALLEEVKVGTDSTALVHVCSPKPEAELQGANTGLSTSDLSSSSEASTTNRGYRYGNQEEYRVEEDDGFLLPKTNENRGSSAGAMPRPSLDLGAPPAPAVSGLENPAFQPTTPAEPVII